MTKLTKQNFKNILSPDKNLSNVIKMGKNCLTKFYFFQYYAIQSITSNATKMCLTHISHPPCHFYLKLHYSIIHDDIMKMF